MLEHLVKSCSPWEGLTLEKFVENCLLWEGPHSGAWEGCEEEGAAETTYGELIATPITCPPELRRGRRERNRSEVEPGKNGGVGGRCFKI